ncbi:hypothetical protein M8C21_020867 [Ambrosia artemisiifolia]|uniref:Uncharacterized protein n=1 Tax=Ambrosia artemisiifolia TaxID=4212 RepID=A0AAD5GLV0_AMBAR|nr:hypothetical protein M8C21_020867 [Ambrosia artemisiifolia]
MLFNSDVVNSGPNSCIPVSWREMDKDFEDIESRGYHRIRSESIGCNCSKQWLKVSRVSKYPISFRVPRKCQTKRSRKTSRVLSSGLALPSHRGIKKVLLVHVLEHVDNNRKFLDGFVRAGVAIDDHRKVGTLHKNEIPATSVRSEQQISHSPKNDKLAMLRWGTIHCCRGKTILINMEKSETRSAIKFGTLDEYTNVEQRLLGLKPKCLDFVQGVALPLATEIAYEGLKGVGFGLDGAGVVGTFIIQIYMRHG